MACPPQHITSLSLDSDGWIVSKGGSSKSERQEEDDGDDNGQSHHQSIKITPNCRKLLNQLKLDLSCDLFNDNSPSTHSISAGTESEEVVPLEKLPHDPNLPNSIMKVIAEIRRLGAPSESDLRRMEQSQGGQGDKNLPPQERNRTRRNRRGRNGKVAQLEEQRRLRQQQEQQKLEQTQQHTEEQHEMKVSDDREENKTTLIVERNDDPNPVDDLLESSVETSELAAVFNSLRILITILRPMMDHPHRQDFEVEMSGPSLNKKKGGKAKFYFISKHVYTCVSSGHWNDVNITFQSLLNEIQDGLSNQMSKVGSDGQYEVNPKDWIVSLFNHDFYMNEELVAEKCMGHPSLNQEVVSKFHHALMSRFENEHDEKQLQLQLSIDRLQDKLAFAISRRFNGARLTVYGSVLSGLALEGSHDVDVSIFIPELDRLKKNFDRGTVSASEYEKKARRIIYQVRDSLEYCRSRSFADLFAITRARVPVVKGTDVHAQNPYTHDGSLSFDLCFLNDIAVVNSSLLREYSLFDNRVRILMLSVKSFAKLNGIASAADGTLSSYSWLNMVVFYLQCIGFLPALQCPKMMQEHDFEPDQNGNPWHSINGLDTFYLTKEMVTKRNIWERQIHVNDASTTRLLFGFFNFYSIVFPQQTVAASIRFGKPSLQKTSLSKTSKLWRLCVEDPFETCSSHCPHDLGCHIKEDGQKRISEHLSRASRKLGAFMQEKMACDDTISTFLCQFLGPMPKSNGEGVKDSASSVAQQARNHPRNAPRQDRARTNTGRHNNRNGKHTNNQRNQSHGRAPKEMKRGNEGHGTNPARSQMKGDGRPGKNDQPVHVQKKNAQKKHQRQMQNKNNRDNSDANGSQPSHQSLQADHPAANIQFVDKQKERLRQITEEKTRKEHLKQNKKGGNTAAVGGKHGSGDKHQKGNSRKSDVSRTGNE